MRAVSVVAAVFVILVGYGAGLCQLDPYPSGFGVYFDENAMINSTTADVGESVQAYVVATRSTWTGHVVSWYCSPLHYDFVDEWIPYDFGGDGLPFSVVPRGAGTNGWSPSGSPENWSGFEFDYDEPFLLTENCVIADVLIPVESDAPTGVFLSEGGCSVIMAGGEYHQLVAHNPVIGTIPPFYQFLAGVNSDVIPVETEQHSWGQLKALYR